MASKKKRVAYRLPLTKGEIAALEFATGRYSWPDALYANIVFDDSGGGEVQMSESEMWNWISDVESDEEGGHSPFPLAAPKFAEKLLVFREGVV